MLKFPDRPLLVIMLGFALVQGLLLSQTGLLVCNTLQRNGNWISTKTTIQKGLMGTYTFLSEPQTLARRRLDLSAWFGFQEIFRATPLPVRSLSCAYALDENAYLCLLYDKTADRVRGVRLSLNPVFPSAAFMADAAGKFLHIEPLPLPPVSPGTWHRVGLHFAPEGTALSLDGTAAATLPAPDSPVRHIGFRGGERQALVDDVVIALDDGTTIREDFGPGLRIWGYLLLVGTGIAAVFQALLALVLGRLSPGDARLRAFRLLLANLVLTVILAGVFAYVYVSVQQYPSASEKNQEDETIWIDHTEEAVLSEIQQRYGTPPPPDVRRILFLGSSQTWGAGATLPEETFVARTEQLLNEAQPDKPGAGLRFECINGGVSGALSVRILRYLDKNWRDLCAHVAVIVLGNNDVKKPQDFGPNLEKIILALKARNIAPMLVLEPNSIEHADPLLSANHETMRALAAQYGLALVDMQAWLGERHDQGFLWWDFVHLTSYGQELAAQRLVEALRPIVAGPAGTCPRASEPRP